MAKYLNGGPFGVDQEGYWDFGAAIVDVRLSNATAEELQEVVDGKHDAAILEAAKAGARQALGDGFPGKAGQA